MYAGMPVEFGSEFGSALSVSQPALPDEPEPGSTIALSSHPAAAYPPDAHSPAAAKEPRSTLVRSNSSAYPTPPASTPTLHPVAPAEPHPAHPGPTHSIPDPHTARPLVLAVPPVAHSRP